MLTKGSDVTDGNETMVNRGAELGQGVSKLIIRLSYNNLYLVYLYKCGVW